VKSEKIREISVLDLFTHSRSCERHIERKSGDYRLPSFVLGEPTAFDRPPEINDLFFGDSLEEILIRASTEGAHRVHSIHNEGLSFETVKLLGPNESKLVAMDSSWGKYKEYVISGEMNCRNCRQKLSRAAQKLACVEEKTFT
jgi:hypothetical protein